MPIEIVTSLISSVIGGLLVATVNYFFTRKKTQAETEKLKAEAEKIRAEAEKVRAEIGRLNTTVEEANYLITASSEQIIYDGATVTNVEDYDIIGQVEIKDGVLIFSEGGFRLRKYTYGGKSSDFLPSNAVLSRRTLRVSFESKVSQEEYGVGVYFESLQKRMDIIAGEEFSITEHNWKKTNLYFQLPPDKDCLLSIRLYTRQENKNGFQFKNLVVAERLSS